jgi:charged multivesicular body protein 2B
LQEAQIRKAAEKGDKLQVQALAKQLVSVRKQREKSYAASSKLGGITTTMTDAQTNMKMAKVMGGTAKVSVVCRALQKQSLQRHAWASTRLY